jgi:hypothetical protein
VFGVKTVAIDTCCKSSPEISCLKISGSANKLSICESPLEHEVAISENSFLAIKLRKSDADRLVYSFPFSALRVVLLSAPVHCTVPDSTEYPMVRVDDVVVDVVRVDDVVVDVVRVDVVGVDVVRVDVVGVDVVRVDVVGVDVVGVRIVSHVEPVNSRVHEQV